MNLRPYTAGDFVHTHDEPVWREKSNYIVHAYVGGGEYEQMYTKKFSKSICELCCIPLFAYGLALGDILEVDDEYLIKCVNKPSGRVVLRAYLKVKDRATRVMIGNTIYDMGGLSEGNGTDLVAIDAPDSTVGLEIRSFLIEMETKGYLEFEDGDAFPYGYEDPD